MYQQQQQDWWGKYNGCGKFTLITIPILLLLIIIGGILIGTASEDQCSAECVETTCTGVNLKQYPCKCGAYCSEKKTDSQRAGGAALIVIAAVWLIVSASILCCNCACALDQTVRNLPPSQPTVVAAPVYGVAAPGTYASPSPQQQGYGGAVQMQYPQKQPAPYYAPPAQQYVAPPPQQQQQPQYVASAPAQREGGDERPPAYDNNNTTAKGYQYQ